MLPRTFDPPATPSPWDRLTYLSGTLAGSLQVAFTVLFFAFVLPHLAPLDATDAEFAAVMAQQSHRPEQREGPPTPWGMLHAVQHDTAAIALSSAKGPDALGDASLRSA